MSILACQEGARLIANATEALRRQCEFPPRTGGGGRDFYLEMEIEELVQAANRHVAEHMMHCPICRSD
jgi:hypothetical protein